jgi:hypothetical protein
MATLPPLTLPEGLRQFLATRDFAMLAVDSDQGTLLVIKAPSTDIEGLQGRLHFRVRHELHQTPYGPLARLVIHAQDRPDSHLGFEMFTNPDDPVQMRDLEDLITRPTLRLVFFDEQHEYRLGKEVTQSQDETLASLPREARRLLGEMDPRDIDFDRAKALVMAEYPV